MRVRFVVEDGLFLYFPADSTILLAFGGGSKEDIPSRYRLVK